MSERGSITEIKHKKVAEASNIVDEQSPAPGWFIDILKELDNILPLV